VAIVHDLSVYALCASGESPVWWAALQHLLYTVNVWLGPPLPLIFGILQELSVVLAHLSGLFESA